MQDATTELPNLMKILTPTPLERAMGRFMRAPDHGEDGGSGGDGGDSGAGADAGAGGGSDAQQPSDAGDGGDDDGSLLGSARTDAGTGDGDQGGDKDKPDAGAGKDGEDKTDGPPEAYDLKLTTKGDDGNDVDVEIDTALLEQATPVLKDIGLTNEQANKLTQLVPSIQQRVYEQQSEEFAALRADWAKEVQADKEIGGNKWPETENLCAKALDSLGFPSEMKKIDGKDVETNPFRMLLNTSGVGNHPEFIRAFRRIGERVAEDAPAPTADAAKGAKPDRLEALYPDDVPGKKQGAQ